jgi:hypothetical protein
MSQVRNALKKKQQSITTSPMRRSGLDSKAVDHDPGFPNPRLDAFSGLPRQGR